MRFFNLLFSHPFWVLRHPHLFWAGLNATSQPQVNYDPEVIELMLDSRLLARCVKGKPTYPAQKDNAKPHKCLSIWEAGTLRKDRQLLLILVFDQYIVNRLPPSLVSALLPNTTP